MVGDDSLEHPGFAEIIATGQPGPPLRIAVSGGRRLEGQGDHGFELEQVGRYRRQKTAACPSG